ncbi:hypothetical protein WAJ79_18545, partial [Acinetobacter baumannii]
MFEIIDDLKTKLDHHRPLPSAIVKNLHEYLLLRWIYHSNAIEGNTLIYAELSGDFPLGDSRQPIYKSLRP